MLNLSLHLGFAIFKLFKRYEENKMKVFFVTLNIGVYCTCLRTMYLGKFKTNKSKKKKKKTSFKKDTLLGVLEQLEFLSHFSSTQ